MKMMKNVSINQPWQQHAQATLYSASLRSWEMVKAFPKLALLAALGAAAVSGMLPADVLAELPTASDEVVPDAVTGTDAMTQGAQLAEMILKGVAAALGVLALIVPVAAIIKSYRARKQGDNDEFHSTMIGGLLVMVLGLGIAIAGFGYAGGIAAQVMALG